MASTKLAWESKLVLLATVPAAAIDVALKTAWWARQPGWVALWTLGIGAVLALVVWRLRAATPAAAATGAILVASLMFSTLVFPYRPWRTALVPGLLVFLLAFAATRLGREEKERLGIAEQRQGQRSAAQVAANLGLAALAAGEFAQSWLADGRWAGLFKPEQTPLIVAAVAALAEAAADTCSSELGQVFGGTPRMITTLRTAEPGMDGAISWAGSLCGVIAAALVAGAGTLALGGHVVMFAISAAAGVFGLFFDSLLGATLERRGWLNNDAVNFLSTVSAAGVALMALASVR